MSYLNPPYANNFKELCAAMPVFYLDVAEMRAVLRAQGHLLDGVCEGMEKLVDVNFILTADDATIRLWEKALGITYRESLTLDQRKCVVIGYIIGLGHIGEQEIRAIIGQYTPNHVDFDFMRGTISIFIDDGVFDEENLLETLLHRIPAHLTLQITIHIRKQYRQDILIAQGVFIDGSVVSEPVAKEHIGFTLPIQMYQAVLGDYVLSGKPPTPEETIRNDLPLLNGSTSSSDNMAGDTPPVKRASASVKTASGGLFCYTHIKSKRID